MKSQNRIAKVLGAKGLYITAAASLAVMAGAGILAYSKAIGSVNESFELNIPDSVITEQAEAKQKDVKKPQRDDSSVSEVLPDESTGKDIKNDKEYNTQPNIMPVNGEIINPFSGGELVKSETLGVWKTHDGVDIKADKGTAVKAMNKGVVTKVWEDTLWGYCVTVDHGNGIVGHYYSLTSAVAVAVDDEVNSGDIIGYVGDTAVVENTEGAHLHFAIKQNGEWTDPIAYINPLGIK
ncbi:MAG: M23 family metallopeptidase [Ruminococcus sp.]|nr:M23 family metallopeptidase [Ruminococcus sp.]